MVNDYENIFYPLPWNEEQKKAASILNEKSGVVILGGHGTGKTSTLVNIACNFAAHGHNILITASCDKQLMSLEKKLPNEIKEYLTDCVSEATTFSDENLSLLDKYKEIVKLRESIEVSIRNQRILEQKLYTRKHIREQKIFYSGRQYTVGEMIKWLEENEKKYIWLEDEIDEKVKCPLTDYEFQRLINLLSIIPMEKMDKIISEGFLISEIPDKTQIEKVKNEMECAKENYEKVRGDLQGWHISLDSDDNLESAEKLVNKCLVCIGDIEKSELSEILGLMRLEEISIADLKAFDIKLNDYFTKLMTLKSEMGCHVVEFNFYIKDIRQVMEDFLEVFREVRKKGGLSNIYKKTHGKYRYIFEGCTADLRQIETMKQAKYIKVYMEMVVLVKELESFYGESGKSLGLKYKAFKLESAVEELKYICENIGKIINLTNMYKQIIKMLRKSYSFTKLNPYDKRSYLEIEDIISYIRNISVYKERKAYISNVERIVNKIGYNYKNNGLQEIEDLKKYYSKAEEVSFLICKLRKTCPRLTDRLLNNCLYGNIQKNCNNFREAWKWRSWNKIIKKLYLTNENEIQCEIQKEKEMERQLNKQLIVKQIAYNKLFQNKLLKSVNPISIVPLNELFISSNGNGIDNRIFDLLIIEDSGHVDASISSVFNYFNKVAVFGNSNGIYENSLLTAASKVLPETLIFKEQFRHAAEIVKLEDSRYCFREMRPTDTMFDSWVIPVKVLGGVRNEKNIINIPEAKAIARQICKLNKDKRYDNMTFGIISLLGNEQARAIEAILLERLGKVELKRRKMLFGEAVNFQGEERDIIFLTMVAAENMRYTSLTKKSDIQRFNLAVSRAKHQTWLYYSMDYDKMNTNCVRYALLRYSNEFNYKNMKKSNYKVI